MIKAIMYFSTTKTILITVVILGTSNKMHQQQNRSMFLVHWLYIIVSEQEIKQNYNFKVSQNKKNIYLEKNTGA